MKRSTTILSALLGALGAVAAMAESSIGVSFADAPVASVTNVAGSAVLSLPNFDEVCQILQTNLAGFKVEQLDRDAVRGLIRQLEPQVSLAGAGESAPAAQGLAGERVFDGSFAWFHVATVSSHLPEQFRAAWKAMADTNKNMIKGLVLDLRFAGGFDYAAAAGLADCFLNSERPLLDWQTGSASATSKTDAITIPVAILVNSQTAGAAEALAAVLRETDVGLVLGGKTAGKADIFKEFPLRDDGKLRVAVAQVRYGSGKTLSAAVTPDIPVYASSEDEQGSLQDPWKVRVAAGAAKSDVVKQEPESPRRNETELIREHRSPAKDTGASPREAPAAVESSPEVTDPVLARALDLLKGLAVVRPNRPG